MVEEVEELSFELGRDWCFSKYMEGLFFREIELRAVQPRHANDVQSLIAEGAQRWHCECGCIEVCVDIAGMDFIGPDNVGTLVGIADTGAIG